MPSLFFAIAFGLAWGIPPLFIDFRAKAEAHFGEMGCAHRLFMLAVQTFGLTCVVRPSISRSW